jgi:hypothetical protein
MNNTTQFVLIAKRILRELNTLSRVVSSGFYGVQEQINSKCEKDAATQVQKPPPFTIVRTITEFPYAYTKKRDDDYAKSYKLQRRNVWLQFGLFLATVGAFGAAAYYVHVATQQREAMEGQWRTAYAQLFLAKKSYEDNLTQAKIQTRAMQSQLAAIKEQFRLEQHAYATSAETASKQLELTDRPWLSVSVMAKDPITLVNGDAQFRFGIAVKNVWHSVATNVTVPYEVFVPKWGDAIFKEPVQRQRQLCGTPPISTPKMPEIISTSIFPDATWEGGTSSGVSAKEIQDGAVPTTSLPEGKKGTYFIAVLVGCVDYAFPSALRHHQTGFIYEIRRLDPQVPHFGFFIEFGKELPVERIMLTRYSLGGDYAY